MLVQASDRKLCSFASAVKVWCLPRFVSAYSHCAPTRLFLINATFFLSQSDLNFYLTLSPVFRRGSEVLQLRVHLHLRRGGPAQAHGFRHPEVLQGQVRPRREDPPQRKSLLVNEPSQCF